MRSSDLLVLLALLAIAGPAAAFEPERDAWLLADTPARATVPRQPRDPPEFARIRATGNDRELDYATGEQARLIDAAEAGERAALETLLQQGVNPNGLSGYRGSTALVHAVARGDVEMVRLLLDAGADPDQRGGGHTPLGLAALRGHTRVAGLLLKAGANPNLKSGDGNTPLAAAAAMNRPAVLATLLAAGADPALFNREGRTALSVAALEGFEDAVRAMLDAGVDANLRDRNGGTALAAAAIDDHKSILKLLVDHGGSSQ
jgi:ankyrin repeat protein